MQKITRKQNHRPLFFFRNQDISGVDLEFTTFIFGRIRQLTHETQFSACLVRSHVDVPVVIPLVFGVVHGVLNLFGDFSQLELIKVGVTLSDEFVENLVEFDKFIRLWYRDSFEVRLSSLRVSL